jgi:hypothetical protein
MRQRQLLLVVGTLFTLTACLLLQSPARAAINPMISFQGKLANPDGTNVGDANYSIRFRIYTDPSADTGACANTCKWEETQGSVSVAGGLFHVNLGSGTALPGSVDFNGSTLYLGIKVGSDAEMTPRVRLTAAPYAFNSDTLDGLDSTAFVKLSPGVQQSGFINVSGAITSGAINGLTLTQAADGFTLAGGTTSRTLTVTGANITIGSTIQPTSAGALIVQSNGSNALTLTSGAAATWSTSAGLLTVQGAGGVTINTPNVSGATGAISLQTGNSSAGTAANISIDTGTTSTGTPTVNLGATNAKAVQIGNNTSNPALTIDSGTGTIAIGTGGQARTINFGTGGAAQAVTVGSTNGASGLDLQAGTGGIDITTQGTGAINIGNNAVAQTINIGNATGATTVAVLCGTGACGFGNNAVAHATTVGSTTGNATTVLQAGTGGLSLTSGANIVLGTSDTTGTLLVLDTKTGSGDPTGVNGGMYYNSANNKFRCHQNSMWSDCISGFNTITKTADQAATQSTTTMQNDTALVFAVNANTTYVFDAWIPVNDSNATADLKYTFTTPASSTLNIMSMYYSSATANVICNIIASATACANTTINQANHFIQVRGQVTIAGTAGNVQFQFAQNTSTAASFPVIKKGATLTWKQSN